MNKTTVTGKRKSKIAERAHNINFIVLVFVLVLLSAMTAALVTGITSGASKKLAHLYSLEAVEKLASYLNRELALVKKVSASKAVTGWFADEGNEAKKAAAFDEMMDSAELLYSVNLYFVVHEALNEYSIAFGAAPDEFVPFDKIDPAMPYDQWYFSSVNSANDYSLNADIDKVTGTRRLWINHKVFENGKTKGVFCSGLPFDEILRNLFSQYDNQNIKGYVIDKYGFIQMDSTYTYFYREETKSRIPETRLNPALASVIDSHLESIGGYFARHTRPSVFELRAGSYDYVSIAPIAETDWSVVTLFNSDSLFSAANLMPLLAAMISALLIYTLVSSAAIRRLVLMPIYRLTESISGSGTDNTDIFGNDRNDEIGELARTIKEMRNRLGVYNSDLIRSSRELERQDRLLHGVNKTAALLLAAEEKTFHSSILEGMELMASCIDADHVYIWQNEIHEGVLHYVPKFEWMNELSRGIDHPWTGTDFSYGDIPEWENNFFRGDCINNSLSGFSEKERKILEPYGIKSVLIIPVHLQGNFWGVVSFNDCHRERTYTEDEINILRSGSLMIASTVNRSAEAAAIREAHNRVQIMLDATPLCCNLWNAGLENILCNEEAVKIFNLNSKEEYLNRFFELSPEYQPNGKLSSVEAQRHIEKAFKEGRDNFEWMHQLLDGTPFPSEITLVRVSYGSDFVVAGYTRDLRTYKQIMRELEQRDTMLNAVNNAAAVLLRSDPDEFSSALGQSMGMMAKTVSADRVYIWKNSTVDGKLCCSQIYEWSEGVESQQDNPYTINVSYDETLPEWRRSLAGGKCINSVVRNLSARERAQLSPQGVLSILLVPVFLRNEFWGFVGFDDCHTERVFTDNEESILRSASLLIANALLRNDMTLRIKNSASKLEIALRDAQSASQAKSNFLSNMSHEIRTPMNAIIGMTMIGKSAPDLKKKDYAFEKIGDASNHLLGVINDVLDMSKIEAGKFELSFVEFNFEKLLQKAVNVISFRVDEKKQRFTVFLDKDIPRFLVGDDQHITQVITNLLSNAVKFTPEQGLIRIDSHLIKEEENICTIKIAVTDTGIGISPEQQSRLFTSFEQAENSTTRKFGGTGLGLSISKHIVELMNGTIWVESELGEGSKFIFTLQVKRGGEKGRDMLLPGIDRSNVKMIAVDDDPGTLECFVNIAAQIGLECDTAPSGAETLRLIDSRGPYNIFFVDWNMPGMNGIELSEKIKSRFSEKSVIIMISATEWNIIERDAKAAGVDDFLSKPLFPSTVADCVNKYIGRGNQGESAEAIPGQAISFPGRRLLLAEDVEINREIVQAMLEPLQLEIDCAVNGREAVEMFRANPGGYDLIFMDLQMPEMDGLEATRLIRAIGSPKAEAIPIIAMTANVFREDIEKCLAAGMNDHVGKPLDFDEVIKKLKIYLPA